MATGHFKQNCFIIIVTASKKNTNQKTAIFTANIYYGKSQRSFPQRNLKTSQTQSKQLQRTFRGQVLFRARFIRGLTNLIIVSHQSRLIGIV